MAGLLKDKAATFVSAFVKGNLANTRKLISTKEEIAKGNKEKLIHPGFQFKYITHSHTNKKRQHLFFSYE